MPGTASRIRTVTIAQGWPDDRPGGLNRYVADLHAALPGAGVDDELVVFGPASSAGSRVHRAVHEDSPLLHRVRSTVAVAAAAGAGCDLLATHFALYGALPAVLPPLRRLPHVAHFHGPWAEESLAQGATGLGPRAKGAVERVHLRRADAVVTASRAFADLVVGLHALPASRVHPVHPGVDLNRFRPVGGAGRQQVRERLGVVPGEHVVLTARRLVPRMGLDVLLAAWPGDQDARLVVLGDGPLREPLQRRVAEEGLRGVHVTGRVSDEDLVLWYQAADLVVVPSVALEGFGLVVLESLACGTPVVASDVGGLCEVLTELGEDLLVGAGDVAAWRDALHRDRAEQLPSREECRALAERHSSRVFAAEVAEVYRAVVR